MKKLRSEIAVVEKWAPLTYKLSTLLVVLLLVAVVTYSWLWWL